MSKLGNRANWSVQYVSDAPRDVLGLTQQQEETVSQFVGFIGTNANEEKKVLNILVVEGVVNLANYATVPVGTIILTPRSQTIFCYQRVSASNEGREGDWRVVNKSTVSEG